VHVARRSVNPEVVSFILEGTATALISIKLIAVARE
jgi:hypothetical protein